MYIETKVKNGVNLFLCDVFKKKCSERIRIP